MLKGFLHCIELALTLCFSLLFSQLASAAGSVVPGVSFNIQDGMLSTHIDNQPLSEILAQLSVQTGIKTEVMPAADRNITLQLSDVPLKHALEQLLRGTNYLFLYQKQDQGYAVSGVRVLASGEAGLVLPLSAKDIPPVAGSAMIKDKESDPEYLRQQKIEAILVQKMRRERGLSPLIITRDGKKVLFPGAGKRVVQ